MDCIFCNIAEGKMPADLLYENEDVVAFRDISPQAPHHIIIIPRQHIATINDINDEHNSVIASMYRAVRSITQDLGVQENGYRTVMNCNGDGGQTVFHIHLHLLAGRQMNWPPG